MYEPINEETLPEHTVTCSRCGTVNDIGNAVCANCMVPLTRYGGQVGQEENFDRRLTAQVAKLETRPMPVNVMTGFSLFFALFWPLLGIIHAFSARPAVNAEGTNGIQSAVGTIVPIATTVVFLPLVVALGFLAYATWKQTPWAYNANFVMLIAFALVVVLMGGLHMASLFWIAVAIALGIGWNRADVRAWYGLN